MSNYTSTLAAIGTVAGALAVVGTIGAYVLYRSIR
ncbi:protein tyrosine kinase [Caudoviricetes sp.]|nr:protein tyrosine kinase [Caudoviricetes sp.]